jgi:hypothetical protein
MIRLQTGSLFTMFQLSLRANHDPMLVELAMVITRRDIVGSIFIGSLAQVQVGGLLTGGEAATENVPIDGMEQFDPLPGGYNGGIGHQASSDVNFGSVLPPSSFRAIGIAILRNAPIKCRPIDVAYYFSDLRTGRIDNALQRDLNKISVQLNDESLANPEFIKMFVYDWERNKYYNPVVVGFFRGVDLRPYAGDQTPWCAAFVNWCISRSRAASRQEVVFSNSLRSFGTKSASSGSFRCWGQDVTSEPKQGDVVVWARNGSVTTSCPTTGQGHVAFLHEIVTNQAGVKSFVVVGGNQGFRGRPVQQGAHAVVKSTDIAQAVSRRTIGLTFADRRLHSIRRAVREREEVSA